jgi:hypothetical protein
MSKSSKGSAFERQLCKLLSSWWSSGKRDDIFWRSAGSGGRATNRSKKGKGTFGSYGDIACVDPIGKRLLDTITLELKRGYSRKSFADIIDRSPHQGQTQFEEFVEQAARSASQAGTPYWGLITRRDSRQAVFFFPRAFVIAMREKGGDLTACRPFGQVAVNLRLGEGRATQKHTICFTTLAQALEVLEPTHFA